MLVLFFLAVALVAPTPVFAQSDPPGENIQAIVIDPYNPTTVYAGGPGFIFKSTDGGATWTQIDKGLTNTSIHSLAIDPSNPATVYAGSAGGVFKSTDGGATWTAISSGLPGPRASLYSKPLQAPGTSVLALVVDPSNTATIYSVVASAVAGVSSLGRIFKSTDGGASWISSNTGLEGCTLFPSGPCTPSIIGLKDTFVFSLAIDPINPTTLYAGTVPGGVFKSINSGASWSSVNFTAASTDIEILATDPVNSGTVYAVAKNDTIRTAPPPHGQTWIAGGNSGIFKTTNGGQTWIAVDSGLPTYTSTFTPPGSIVVQSFAIDPSNPATLYSGVVGDSTMGVFKSTNGGASWTAANTGLTPQALAIDPSNTSTIYAGTSSNTATISPGATSVDGGVFKSTNGGASWTAINSDLTNPR